VVGAVDDEVAGTAVRCRALLVADYEGEGVKWIRDIVELLGEEVEGERLTDGDKSTASSRGGVVHRQRGKVEIWPTQGFSREGCCGEGSRGLHATFLGPGQSGRAAVMACHRELGVVAMAGRRRLWFRWTMGSERSPRGEGVGTWPS
jgi:hypothetical protein